MDCKNKLFFPVLLTTHQNYSTCFTHLSSSIYYPGEFSPLVGVGQSFHRSPPPNIPIPCILLHYSPLFMSSSTTSIHRFTGLPLFLCPSVCNSNTFFISTSSSLHIICPNHLNLFCLKCSSRSSTSTLDAITVLSTISFTSLCRSF